VDKNFMGFLTPVCTFSILFVFNKFDFGNYWFKTGTPTFLINALSYTNIKMQDLAEGVTASEEEM